MDFGAAKLAERDAPAAIGEAYRTSDGRGPATGTLRYPVELIDIVVLLMNPISTEDISYRKYLPVLDDTYMATRAKILRISSFGLLLRFREHVEWRGR